LFLLLPKLGIEGNLGYGINFAGFDALICAYMGFIVGWVSGKKYSSLIRTGLWIWVLPTTVALCDIVPALLQSGATPRLSEYVYATGDNEGLGVILLTLPVSSAVGYSVGMLFARAERAVPRADAVGLRTRVLFGWVATLAVACTLMVGTERHMVKRDRKIRVAVRIAGTPLASDANALCEPVGIRAVGKPVVLKSVTKLEFLEHAECPGGRPTSGIDRVRVLDGPNKSLEGWVVTSQVWRPLPLP
jgi:hypothetical protein